MISILLLFPLRPFTFRFSDGYVCTCRIEITNARPVESGHKCKRKYTGTVFLVAAKVRKMLDAAKTILYTPFQFVSEIRTELFIEPTTQNAQQWVMA